MYRSRFTEAQMACDIRRFEQGSPTAELYREMGTSERTFYTWRKHAGVGLTGLRRASQLEDENRR
jgi:hypothetical protein